MNRNGKDWLPTIYESLRNDEYANRRVYLVDNASEDDSLGMTRESFPEVTVIRLGQNTGYCIAYNLAMPYAFAEGCDWVIWANNDIRLEPGCLGKLVRVAQSDPHIGVLGPAFLAWDSDEPNGYMVGNHPQAISAMKERSQTPIDVEWVEGSFLMVSRRCVEAVGPLDPYLFFYWEEADFCRRARYQGWRVVLVPSALARHYAGGWSAEDKKNRSTANWLQSRNYYIYKLANPFQGFARNVRDALRLFLVIVKTNLPDSPYSLVREIRVFVRILSEIYTIGQKWKRDRLGGKPSITTENYKEVSVEVLRGTH